MAKKLLMKNDIVFKAFFNRNQHYLKSLLSAILGKDIKIKKVIHDARLEQLSKEMKYGILDLEVELENGEIVNIEMQLKDNKNIEKRTTFYASKKIVEQLEPKGEYENLKRVIVIAILDYTLTDLPEYVTETVRVSRNHKGFEINNIVKYYYIELEKFRNQNPDMKDKLNQWLAFLDMERSDLLDMAKEENEEIKNAVEDYEVLTGDAEVKRLAEIRLMSELEEHSALATARYNGKKEGEKIGREEGEKIGKKEGEKIGREEGEKIGRNEGEKIGRKEGEKIGRKEGEKIGRKEGEKIGRKEGKLEITKKLLEAGMDIQKIAEITGFSIEEINELKVE